MESVDEADDVAEDDEQLRSVTIDSKCPTADKAAGLQLKCPYVIRQPTLRKPR